MKNTKELIWEDASSERSQCGKKMSGDAKSGKIWTSKKLMNDAQIRDGNCLRSRCHGSQPSYSMLFVMAGRKRFTSSDTLYCEPA
jgi:hypothetical protein